MTCSMASLSTLESLTSALPSHPTAVAFFAALDGSNNEGNNNSSGTTARRKRQSDRIKKRCQTLGWRNRHSQDEFYPITVVVDNANDDGEETTKAVSFSVRQVQRGEVDGTYGTGATVWPASVVLLKYLERHRDLIRNKTVVDLGSGTGITSIGAALLGAKGVICTDGCAKVVHLANDNIRHAIQEIESSNNSGNGSKTTATIQQPGDKQPPFIIKGCTIDVQEYWWGKGSVVLNNNTSKDSSNSNSNNIASGDGDLDRNNKNEMNTNNNGSCDDIDNKDSSIVVLVSDCVLPKLYPIAPLVQALDELLPKEETNSTTASVAILSYEHRYFPEYDPRDKFRDLANNCGLQVDVIPPTDHHDIYSVEDIEIWHVSRRELS